MTIALNLIAGSGSEVEWSRTLMIAWLVIALALSVIEVFWLKGGFSLGRLSPAITRCGDC
jgi:hypothetical protein